MDSLNAPLTCMHKAFDDVIQADESFLQSLFKELSSDDIDDVGGEHDGVDSELCRRRRRDVAQFLKEFCLFSQTLAPQNREGFFKVIMQMFIHHRFDQPITSCRLLVFCFLCALKAHLLTYYTVFIVISFS